MQYARKTKMYGESKSLPLNTGHVSVMKGEVGVNS